MPDWRTRAACAGMWPLFDAACESVYAVEPAKAVCRGCPVAEECLMEAMTSGEVGIWGGTAPDTRTRHGGQPHGTRTTRLARTVIAVRP